jgi:PAS domain S-box-containing protein
MMTMQIEAEKAINTRSLTTTLSIAFITLSVAVLLIAGSFEIYFHFQTQRENVAVMQQHVARDAASAVSNFIQEKFSILETAVKLENPADISLKEQKKALQILLGLQPAFRHLVLLDSQEKKLAGVSRLPQVALERFMGQLGDDLFSRIKQGTGYIGPVYVDEITSEPLVIMAVPVTDIFGDFQGTLMTEVNLKFMWDLVERLKIGEAGLAYVVDRQGNLIAFGDIARVLRGENIGRLKEVSEFIGNHKHADETGANISKGINGTTIVGTYVPLGTPDWAVVTELPVKEAYQKVIQSTVISAGIMLVMAIIAGLIGINVARRLSVPLLNLTGTATRIAEGNMGLMAPVEGPAEVARLARAFNNMTGQLREMLTKEEERTRKLQQEIVQRQLAEEALLESEGRYRTLTNNLNVGIYRNTVGSKGKFIEANPAIVKLFGYDSREEFIRTNVSDLYKNPDDRKKFNAKMLQNGAVLNEEEQLKKKDGKLFIASISAVSVKDEKGEVQYYDGIVEDITERKHMEKALRESEEKYRTVLETSTDPIVVYDTEGKVTYFNPAFTRVFGWTLEERLGKKMDVFVHDEEWPETRKMIDKVLAGESFSGFETRRYTKEGNIVHVNMSASIYKDQNGNLIGSVINLRDISEQKKLETQLQRAQKMEAIGALAGGVAHDLNNILSGIVSYPELLLLDLPQDSPFKKPLLTIQKSGAKAAAIVQDLLTLARRGVAVTDVVNLNHIISDYMQSPEYEKLLSFHPNTSMKTNLETDLLDIMGSPVHLTKTVMNLISNAAEATLNGGTITIATKNQYIDKPFRGYEGVIEGDYVVLIIADDGIGISLKDMEQIFEPFFTKKVMGRSGTGLGMSVVWGTVKDHNGYIDVQSKEGKGTSFTLYFPVTRKKRAIDESLLSIEEYMGKGESILVVDDVEEQREIATKMLKKLGYSVTSVSSGEEALEYIKNNSADLIVLDMIMDPGINGRETYERIIKIHPNQKAVIASGFAETYDAKKAQKLGAGQYIKKPYTLEKIGIAVRDELKK